MPLLVNTADSWKHRPEAKTELDNFFLAADFVRTYTDLATMEGANEAARLAVNCILEREDSTAPREKIYRGSEPLPFRPLKWLDSLRHKANKSQLQFKVLWMIALTLLGHVLNVVGIFAKPFIPEPKL